jgi:PAS domain S-box-containing protein
MPNRKLIEACAHAGAVGVVCFLLYLSSLHSYLLFHTLVEISTVAVAFVLFILAWNTRAFLSTDSLKLLGIGYGFIAIIDLVHTLVYKGMSVFAGYDSNLPTQLWISARYLQAATLLAAPLFVRRKINEYLLSGLYFAAVALVLTLTFSDNFPDCFIEGKGLTPFKIFSEYVITAVLLVSLYLFHRTRGAFSDRVYALVAASIVCTIVSELTFTTFLSLYGFTNMLGHLLKLAAFYLIYQALLVTGLREPFDLIFRDLKQTEDALRKARDGLEETVAERTAALRASEEKYRLLFETANDGIFLQDAGGFIDCNQRGAAMYGCRREDLIGRSPANFCPERQADGRLSSAVAAERMRAALQGDPQHFEWQPKRCDGSVFDVDITLSRIQIGSSLCLQAIVRDISDRKRAELDLQRTNRELRAISNCNEALLRADDEQTLLNEICRIVCEQADYRMAWVGFAVHDHACTVRPAASGGVDDGYVTATSFSWGDTEIGRGPCGMAIRNGQSACIQDFATDPLAAPWREKALQRSYRSCVSLPLKDERAATFGVLTIYSTEANAFTAAELRLLEELAGDLAFGICVLRGRAERMRAEAEIRELNLQLEQRVAERTAQLQAANKELEAFSYSISHDLRAPLRAIDGFSSLLLEQCASQLDENGKHNLDRILGSVALMRRLIDDVLQFSRTSTKEMRLTPVDMATMVRDVFSEVDDAADRNIVLRLGVLPPAMGDRMMIRQVLVNLLGNAVKYTARQAEAVVEVDGVAADGKVSYRVKDNGAGFDMRYVDRLFGVFQRLHSTEEFDGTGIGLAIVKRIVERHGGQVSAEGKVGEGATFTFTLPACSASS